MSYDDLANQSLKDSSGCPAISAQPSKKLLLKKLSEVRKLTTFYAAKNDHRWVTYIFLKTINAQVSHRLLTLEDTLVVPRFWAAHLISLILPEWAWRCSNIVKSV